MADDLPSNGNLNILNQPINQSINISSLFKKEGKHITAETDKPVDLQLN